MTTYAPPDTSKRVGNKRAPILNLCMTPAEQYHFTLPTWAKSTQKERPQGTSWVADFPHAIIFLAQRLSLRIRINDDFVRLFEDEDFRVTRVGDRR